MVDENKIKELLVELLEDVAEKAKADALAGESDIASIYRRDNGDKFAKLDPDRIAEAISYIKTATATKAGARRVVNAIMVAAKAVANIYLPNRSSVIE